MNSERDARLALVTGGTGGIGAAICLRLAEAGHRVVPNYRNEEKTQRWRAQCLEKGYDILKSAGPTSVTSINVRTWLRSLKRHTGAHRHTGQQRRRDPRHDGAQDDPGTMDHGDTHRPRRM